MLNISLVTKIIKKLQLYAYSFLKWVYIKCIYDYVKTMYVKIKCMYFIINENNFDKYMTTWEKVSYIIKRN